MGRPIFLDRNYDKKQCMAVFSDGFINENFLALPDRLSTSQEVYRGQFQFIQQKCDDYMEVIKQLDYLIDDFFCIPCPIESYIHGIVVPQYISDEAEKAYTPIWQLHCYIRSNLKKKFVGYEETSQVLAEYWSVNADLPEAIKQVEQLKLALEQRKKDLASFKKQHQSKGAKGKAKKMDKNSRKEMKTLESEVKMAQAEVTSAQQSLSSLYNRIAELKKEAGDRELPIKSEWEKMLSDSYANFRDLAANLLKEIRKIQYVFANYNPAKTVASVCITQNDIDGEKDKCHICWQEYSVGDNVKVCHHCKQYLHEGCIGKWLKTKAECPLCRQSPWNSFSQ